MDKALTTYKNAPLDVRLVHFGTSRGAFSALEKGRKQAVNGKAPAAQPTPTPAMNTTATTATSASENDSKKDQVVAMFAKFDDNGDGVIDSDEMAKLLIDLGVCKAKSEALAMFEVADANDDGELHYQEFADWLYGDGVDASTLSKLEGVTDK